MANDRHDEIERINSIWKEEPSKDREVKLGKRVQRSAYIALLLMAGIRERLELADMPENLKGLPITFIIAGLLAIAFLGFSGMKI